VAQILLEPKTGEGGQDTLKTEFLREKRILREKARETEN
jgi:hypothetical protein